MVKLLTYEAAETWESTSTVRSLEALFKVHNMEFLQNWLGMASEFSAESCGGTVVFVRSLYIYLHSLCIYVRMCVCVYVIYI